MINIEKLKLALLSYRKAFVTPDPAAKNQTSWEKEQYKWIAVKCFQDNWNIDADDFLEMFKKSTAKCENLLSSMNYFPRQMIIRFAEVDAEAVRNMFRELFDEDKSVVDRVNRFIQESERIRSQYGAGRWDSHYQNVNSVSTYLWLRYPDKYYIYKYSEWKQVASVLESDFKVKKGAKADALLSFLSFYNEIADYLKTDAEISAIKNAEKDGHKFPQQTCEFCGKEYWPTTPNQRYCTPDCLRNGRISARHDGRNPAEKDGHPYFERTCIVCGKKFWPNGPSTKTCSEECRRERARQQGREFRERQKQTEAEKTA